MNFGQILLGALTGTIEPLIDAEVEKLLQDEHDKHPEAYAAMIKGELLAMAELQPLLANSKSKVLQAFVAGVNDAFTASAAKNGITL